MEFFKKAHLEGKVITQILIGVDGNPKKTKILYSDNKIFNESVVRAIEKCKCFVPAIMDKKPIASWITIPVVFKLN